MFDLDTFTTILIAVVPALTAIAAIAGGIAKIARMFKKNVKHTVEKLEEKTAKMEHSFDEMHIIKQKLESIEKYLLEEKEKKR